MAKLKYDAKRRRALNMVWDTSADYRFQPDFLAYGDDGAPDLYLNAVVGFTRKYYDTDQLHAMFQEMENSALVDTFTDLLWLGLEYATYARRPRYGPCCPSCGRSTPGPILTAPWRTNTGWPTKCRRPVGTRCWGKRTVSSTLGQGPVPKPGL